MHRSALLLVVLVAVATGCPEGARPGDGAVPPSSAFDAPQAIAASQRFVLVASTAFHFEGSDPAWGPGFVTVLERSSRRVVARIPTSQLNPQAIAVHGETAYVVNGGSVAVDRDSGLVTAASDGGIDVIDLGDIPRRVANIPLGRSAQDRRIGCYGSIAVDASGRYAFVGSGTRGDLFKVDLEQRRVLRGPDRPIVLFPVDPGANGLTTVRRAGNSDELAVLSFNSDELCLSDDWTGDLARRSCGGVGVQDKLLEGPIDLARAPDGRLLVLMTIANSLYRVDGGAKPFVVEHAFAKTGLANNRVVVHGGRAYVVNSLSNNLQRVELASGKSRLPFAVLPVGSMPYDLVITLEQEGALAWVTLNGHHAVALVRLDDGVVLQILRGETSDGGVPDGGVPDGGRDRGVDLRPCPEAGLPPVVGIEDVVQVSYGDGAGDGQSKLPGVIQGGPAGGGTGSGSTDDVLSLGVGGEIVVGFGAHDIVDGPGPDFIVFENPFLVGPFNPFAEPAWVAASAADPQPSSFVGFPCDMTATSGDPASQSWPYPGCGGVRPVLAGSGACVPANDPALAGGDAFDLADIGLERARYLRLTDAGVSKLGNTSKGFDLDAIVLINFAKR